MKVTSLFPAVAALALAGCTTCSSFDTKDPLIGNWGLKLPYDRMNAGHMIVSRNADGKAQAVVLWRWGSPEVSAVETKGDTFVIDHPWKLKIEGKVDGMKLTAKVVSTLDGKEQGEMIGWRNPPICDKVSTKDARFGDPIDLLAKGLDGFKPLVEPGLEKEPPNGWSIKDDNGVKILSNVLPVDEKGEKIHGVNISTVREDFYDFNLDYDVRVPKDSNSGVYLRGRYEIQTFDSFGKPVDCHNMAAYYGRVTPSVAAEKPAGEWQHVNVTLYKRHLTVVLNGTTIIDNVPVVGITGGAMDANEFVPGPLYLQGDHSDADYKNMILRKVVN